MKNFLDKINKLSELKFITFSILIALIFTIPFDIYHIYSNTYMGLNLITVWDFLFAIIILPIFKSILIVIVTYFIKQAIDNKFMITFISAILLIGTQNYSVTYLLMVFIPSFIFVSAYTLYDNNKKLSSFLVMMIINLIYSIIQTGFIILAKNLIQ